MPPSLLDQALAHRAAGRLKQAQALLSRLLGSGDPEVVTAMALVCSDMKQHDQALFHARRAVSAAPGRADLLAEASHVHYEAGEIDEAARLACRALRIDPGCGGAAVGLIRIIRRGERAMRTERTLREVVEADPDHLAALIPYMTLLLGLGRAEEAVRLARGAFDRLGEARPGPLHVRLASSLANAMNYLETADPEGTLREHRRYAEVLERVQPSRGGAARAARGEGALRVGLLSPDLRTHSVAFFVEPLLRGHDRSRVRLIVFSTAQSEDETSERYRTLADEWHACGEMTDDRLAEFIRGQRLDVLIELSGHTANHSLAVMARRPAPVQATYCGYPNTTGLAAIDYRIVDSITDPAPAADGWCTEKPARLAPCFLCYAPPHCPEPGAFEAGAGPVFASFNNLAKVNGRVLSLWAEVLGRVPGSRLVLKAGALADAELCERIRAGFAERSIGPERVELLARTASFEEHMGLYRRVWVALDTFPYAGTTTTCEALWMGVPVVTLARPDAPHRERVGLSLLSAAGLEEWAAASEGEYVEKAAALAGDAARLASLRGTLRARLASSALCDEAAFCRGFEGMLEGMVG